MFKYIRSIRIVVIKASFKRKLNRSYNSLQKFPFIENFFLQKMANFINFVKMHGLGNDILMLKKEELHLLGFKSDQQCDLFVQMCKRKSGIGADQIFIYSESFEGAENSNSSISGVEVQIFNSDGSESYQCGNGLRCLAYLLHTRSKCTEVKIHYLDWKRSWDCSIFDNGKEIMVNMGKPNLEASWMPSLDSIRKIIEHEHKSKLIALDIGLVDIGNPHLIIFTPLLEAHFEKDMEVLAQKFQESPIFKKSSGVNVSFASIESEEKIRLRVWERGAGSTSACGSAAVSTFAAAQKFGLVKCVGDISVRFSDGDLKLHYNDNGEAIMKGPASIVAIGKYFIKT